jgi:hypothetical protein
MFCNRCGKRFASGASVQNHQSQLSSRCWKTYSLLLDVQHSVETMESPPPTPSLLPEVDMEIVDNIDDQPPQQEAMLPSFHTEFFLGSAKVFGNGETYLDLFDEDEYADARETNLYYPFASQPEWELASFLLRSNLSRVAIDQLLKLQSVSIMQSIEF